MDLFDKLPEDIVVSKILSRVDLKSLCQRLVVSKEFASMIYRIGTVTIMADDDDISHWNSGNYLHLLYNILGFTREEILKWNILGFIRSLEKFRDLKFIRVEFNSHNYNQSPLRMRLLCRSVGSRVDNMVIIVPASVRKMSTHGESVKPLNKENPLEFMGSSVLEKCKNQCQRIGEWTSILLLLIKCHIPLESITVADPNRHDKDDDGDKVFVLNGVQLVKWRKLLLCKQFPVNQMSKVMFGTNFHLPVSKYVMENTLCICLVSKTVVVDDDDSEDLFTWQYNGEEELIAEAFKSVSHSRSFLSCRVE